MKQVTTAIRAYATVGDRSRAITQLKHRGYQYFVEFHEVNGPAVQYYHDANPVLDPETIIEVDHAPPE